MHRQNNIPNCLCDARFNYPEFKYHWVCKFETYGKNRLTILTSGLEQEVLIVNRSLLSSVFPVAWKTSEVVPLPKDGDHEMANNNRPVSLLPAASKVCERIALNQLTYYLNKNNRLTEHQSGNRVMHSCATLNMFITDKVLEAMD